MKLNVLKRINLLLGKRTDTAQERLMWQSVPARPTKTGVTSFGWTRLMDRINLRFVNPTICVVPHPRETTGGSGGMGGRCLSELVDYKIRRCL